MKVHIRPETKEDIAEIWRINAAAFDTDAEANLVDNLRESGAQIISLVAGILAGYRGVVRYHRLFKT